MLGMYICVVCMRLFKVEIFAYGHPVTSKHQGLKPHYFPAFSVTFKLWNTTDFFLFSLVYKSHPCHFYGIRASNQLYTIHKNPQVEVTTTTTWIWVGKFSTRPRYHCTYSVIMLLLLIQYYCYLYSYSPISH